MIKKKVEKTIAFEIHALHLLKKNLLILQIHYNLVTNISSLIWDDHHQQYTRLKPIISSIFVVEQ